MSRAEVDFLGEETEVYGLECSHASKLVRGTGSREVKGAEEWQESCRKDFDKGIDLPVRWILTLFFKALIFKRKG